MLFTISIVISLSTVDTTSSEDIRKHIYFLASDFLEGRLIGENELAREYIEFYLKKWGYEVVEQAFETSGKTKIDTFYSNLPLQILPFSSSGILNSKKEIAIVDAKNFDEHDMINKSIEFKNKGKKGIIFIVDSIIGFDDYFKNDVGIICFQLERKYIDSLKRTNEIKAFLKLSREKIKGVNIFALKKGKSLNYIIIGAHYDHLGYGSYGSLSRIKDIHNGADDNASGIAGVLELAEYYKDKDVRDNLVFAFWDGEEEGTLGSDYYIKNPLFPLQNTKAYINFDMIGRMKDSTLMIIGYKTANEFEDILKKENQHFDLKLSNSGFGFSDQNGFYKSNIPVLHFFTGSHKDYHKITDDPEFINYDGEKKILDYVIKIIDDISKIEALTFHKVAEEMPISRTRNVRLGIIPDYSYEGEGVKIDNVIENLPAQKYGLKSQDIILKIDKFEIKNIYDLTYVLSKFKKGQKVEIIYKRENEIKKLKIAF